MENAIDAAMDTCIEKDVLTDILVKCRSEVYSMLLTEYNEKEHLKIVKADGIKEGIQQGIEQGIEQGRNRQLILMVCRKIKKEKTLNQIAIELDESLDVITPIYRAALQFAPDYNVDKIYDTLNNSNS